MRRFTVIAGSARHEGNTAALARLALAGLPATDEVCWMNLRDLPLNPFDDLRHQGGGRYPAPTGNEKVLLDATLWASDLVFAAPVYWYSLPASLKLYLDYWSGWMRIPGVDFTRKMVGRTLWIITVNANDPGDDSGTDSFIGALEQTAAYLGMRLGGTLIGHGNRPGQIREDSAAIAAAAAFFQR